MKMPTSHEIIIKLQIACSIARTPKVCTKAASYKSFELSASARVAVTRASLNLSRCIRDRIERVLQGKED